MADPVFGELATDPDLPEASDAAYVAPPSPGPIFSLAELDAADEAGTTIGRPELLAKAVGYQPSPPQGQGVPQASAEAEVNPQLRDFNEPGDKEKSLVPGFKRQRVAPVKFDVGGKKLYKTMNRKSRKSRKARKARKARKSRKARKARKSRKSRKAIK